MPCRDAMITDVVCLEPGQTVEKAMAILEKHSIRVGPVLDEDKKLLGFFGFKEVLLNLLPVAVTMNDGLERLDFVIGAAPGVGQRLRKLKPQKVELVMDRKLTVAHPHMPMWEVLRLLVKYGSPIAVVEEDTNVFLGIVTEQSALANLEKTGSELEKEVKHSLKDKKGKKK